MRDLVTGFSIPTQSEKRAWVPRRSEPIDAFGDGLTVCYEDDERRDRVLLVDRAGAVLHSLSADHWQMLAPFIDRPTIGDALRALTEELKAVKLQPKLQPSPQRTNRHERRAAASKRRRRNV